MEGALLFLVSFCIMNETIIFWKRGTVMSDDGLMTAILLDGKGGGKHLNWDEIRAWNPEQGVLWLHFNYTDPGARKWVTNESRLHMIVVEALLTGETRPRTTIIDDSVLMALRGVNLNPDSEPEDMVSIRIWADKYRIISTGKRKLLSITDLIECFAQNDGPGSSGDFIVELSGRLTSRMEGTIDGIEDHIAETEEEIIDANRFDLRQEISLIRREAIMLRRYLAPQREALAKLYSEKISWFSDDDRMRLREVTDRLIRYIEDLDSMRDRASVTQEEIVSRLSEQMNSRMYVLSLVAAIFLPLSFLTGLLGINVAGIPGANYSGAFLLFVLFLAGIGTLQIMVFKKNKWL